MDGAEGSKGRTALIVVLVIAIVVCGLLWWRVQTLSTRLARAETGVAALYQWSDTTFKAVGVEIGDLQRFSDSVGRRLKPVLPRVPGGPIIPPPPQCPPKCNLKHWRDMFKSLPIGDQP